jgi:thiamine biosynthesis lipoprotein
MEIETDQPRGSEMMDTLLTPTRRRLLGGIGSLGALALIGYSLRPAPQSGQDGVRFGGETMGTRYSVTIAGAPLSKARLEAAQADVHAALDGVDRRMSLYRADSELTGFNAHPTTPLQLSEDLFAVLVVAQTVSRLSGGAFDVSVAPLVRAWGFGPERPSALPSPQEIETRRALIGYRGLRLDPANRTAIKAHGGLQADLGGVAKGYGVDLAARALEALGIGDYMIEAGGEVRASGLNREGRPWRIGIEEPDVMPRRARLVVPLSGAAMATSGDYRNYFERGGKRYSHEIDPVTASPITHELASVTVVTKDCAQADALSTALMVLGPQKGWMLADRASLAAHFIIRDPGGTLRDRATPAFLALSGRA